MEWVKSSERLPSEGDWLVAFVMEVLGSGKEPLEEVVLYAKGHFNPEKGWFIDARYIRHMTYNEDYIAADMRVTHWMEIPPLSEDEG